MSRPRNAGGIATKVLRGILGSDHPATKRSGVQTGFCRIDQMPQAFGRGRLTVLAGLHDEALTGLCLSIVIHNACWLDQVVAHLTPGLESAQLVRRLLVLDSGVNLGPSVRRADINREGYVRLGVAHDRVRKARLYVDDAPIPDVRRLNDVVSALALDFGIDCLIVDWDRRAGSTRGWRHPRTDGGAAARHLKQAAVRHDMAVLLVSRSPRWARTVPRGFAAARRAFLRRPMARHVDGLFLLDPSQVTFARPVANCMRLLVHSPAADRSGIVEILYAPARGGWCTSPDESPEAIVADPPPPGNGTAAGKPGCSD
jgi:hypothetical protein